VPVGVFLFFFPLPKDVLHLSRNFWIPVLASCVVQYPAQIYCYLRAIREGELSSVVPLMAITPLFNIATSFIFLHEIPTTVGFVGIVVIATGIYFLLKKKGIQANRRPELFMALSMFCLAIGATLDKIAIKASTPVFYSFVNIVISSIVLFICMYLAREHGEVEKMKAMFGKLFLVGILISISYVSLELAFSLGPTSYVLAIRTGSVVLASAWGLIKLKEEFSWRKLFAIFCFILGSLLLFFA
jgi:uncharacterized membrane protein